jgi:hypothetical protein
VPSRTEEPVVAGLEPFCKRAVAHEIREARTPTSFELQIGWSDGGGPAPEA